MSRSKISELFTFPTCDTGLDWEKIVEDQPCFYLNRKCIKVRKSEPSISIGTCSVQYGNSNIIICPHRLLQNKRIFLDSIHLLTLHEPGNDLHIVSELSIPGGNVDYFLVSARDGKVVDFVGIELQTLDTTGTLWNTRQHFLQDMGVLDPDLNIPNANFGMNWKMTAKTILVQLHHKIDTFEHLSKHLVLVLQDNLLEYMSREFSFSHISNTPSVGHAMHFHSYQLVEPDGCYKELKLMRRMSTDAAGISACLGLQAQARVELEIILDALQSKISPKTLFTIA